MKAKGEKKMRVFILELYKKKNIIEHCGTIDYYVDEKVGELVFTSKPVACSVKKQLEAQQLFDKVKYIEV